MLEAGEAKPVSAGGILSVTDSGAVCVAQTPMVIASLESE